MERSRSIGSIGVSVALILWLPSSALAQFYPQPQAVGQAASAAAEATIESPRELSDHARQMLEDAELCDVAFVDAQRGWAVGDRGVIWHTADSGRTWQLQPSGVDCRLHSVHFTDPQTGWVVGGFVHPYTHRTTGVVLRTRDGGKRWASVSDRTLPMLRRVKFVSVANCWLIGEPSPIYPSGVLFSRDAGKSWQPVPGEAPGRWLCGDFRDDQGGAIAGRDGAMHVATAKGFLASRAPQLGLRAIRDVRFEARSGGWLVGDGGIVMSTVDAGLSWQPPRGALPPAARREFDFRGVAVVGQRVWAVGSPGSQVLHSPDGGQTWQLQPTGQTSPLLAITFSDPQHGWAVGALGTILATRDGGRTWLRQHSGGTRAAMLAVLADAEDLPLELVARLASEEGYLTVAEVMFRRDVDLPFDFAANPSDCGKTALCAVGGSGLYQAWSFPLRERQLLMDRERIIATWDQLHESAGMNVLREQLVRRIRQWQPDVVVMPSGAKDTARAEDVLLAQTTLQAVAAAADPSVYPDQISVVKLPPWQVKKVFEIAAPGEADDVTLSSARLAMRSGQSLADLAARAQSFLAAAPTVRPANSNFRLATHHVEADAARRDIVSGLTLNPGGEARRRLSDPTGASADFVREQAQRQRHLEGLLAAGENNMVNDATWLGEIEQVTSHLQQDGASRAIFRLAQRYSEAGRLALSADALQMLVERYGETPEAEAAQRKLFLDFVSREQAWRQASQAAQEVRPATAIGPVDRENVISPVDDAAVRASPVATVGVSIVEKSVLQRCRRAMAIFQAIERTRPRFAAEPSMQLALAAAQRVTGETKAAEATYRRLVTGDDRHAWVGCARAELWLLEKRGACPRPLVRCKMESERPFLDGRLDDVMWQTAQPLALTSRYGDDRAWPAVAMVSCDGEFLYFAATCRRSLHSDLHVDKSDGSVEESVLTNDRVELLLDIDRDWNSHFKFVADAQGATAEFCVGEVVWNPKWYISHRADDATWTVEAAIPLASLGADAIRHHAWAMGVQRVAPGCGVQSWSQPAAASGLPFGMGLITFE
jgi:photosystem II stability/assembly factor-like uncharacterized protein